MEKAAIVVLQEWLRTSQYRTLYLVLVPGNVVVDCCEPLEH